MEASKAQMEAHAFQASAEAEAACAAAAVAEAMTYQGGEEATSYEITAQLTCSRLGMMRSRIALLTRDINYKATLSDDGSDGERSEDLASDQRCAEPHFGGGSLRPSCVGNDRNTSHTSHQMLPESAGACAALCNLENDLMNEYLFKDRIRR